MKRKSTSKQLKTRIKTKQTTKITNIPNNPILIREDKNNIDNNIYLIFG